jgi:hypothetical protein
VPTKRSSRFVIAGVVALGAATLAVALLLPGRGASAPVHLPPANGKPVLVSFLDTQAPPSAEGNASRSQLVVVKSMDTQSRAAGLRTVIVDTAHASAARLVNFRYDWSLPAAIRVLGDPRGALAREYHVDRSPTTVLLDGHGAVIRRWGGYAAAAELDFAVRRATGRHVFGTP